MDLRSYYPYWLLKDGIIRSYPSLITDITTDVVIMGGGISGALAAWHLCKAGVSVVVVDKRHIGMGSTAASTALLQYEIDTPLRELIKKVGEKNAVNSYLACLQSIDDLEAICNQVHFTEFTRRPSFQFASHKKDVGDLRIEYELRRKAGIVLDFLEAEEVEEKFGFKKHAGILSRDGAEVNAYALTHALLEDCKENDLQVFDHTEITDINFQKRSVHLITAEGFKIKTRKLIVACGYESQKYLPTKVEQFHTTYAIISEPFLTEKFWHKNAIIWETARPYLYLRTTVDNRIIVGGKDDEFSNPDKRDNSLTMKAKALEKSFAKLFPQFVFRTDFRWGGTFAETKDGLPYIGTIKELPHTYFALGYGGNGITFSVLAAQIIRDHLLGKSNPNAELFDFER